MAEEVAIYFDASKCSACKGCQINCKQWNRLPGPTDSDNIEFSGSLENPKVNDGDTWLHMSFNEVDTESAGGIGWAFNRVACMHCTDAPCVEACPTGACHKVENGATVIDADKCVGCKYCVAACPFHVPKYRERDGVSQKCWLCQDRLKNGIKPACVMTCPCQALDYGPRDQMVDQAKQRVVQLRKTKPKAEVYGIDEMGGLHVIEVLPYGVEAHGMPKDPKAAITSQLSRIIKPITGIGVAGMAVAMLASFIGGRGYKRGPYDLEYHPELGEGNEIVDTTKKEA